jgi:formiminoglutamase
MHAWLQVTRGTAPLVLSFPHTGIELEGFEHRFTSPWLARKDADLWVDRLYDFAAAMDATLVRTTLSRSIIDVNRDPSGISLYPGQATTELCPTTTFDGEPLYRTGEEPDGGEIAHRRALYFNPYHAALAGEIARLRALHPRVVVYDCHSIRSRIPRLFDGDLPHFNIGTNGGVTCDPRLSAAIANICESTSFSTAINGRFKGGYITRANGRPQEGVHAVQMELAIRGYMREMPGPVAEAEWPVAYDPAYAAPMRAALTKVMEACLVFASQNQNL